MNTIFTIIIIIILLFIIRYYIDRENFASSLQNTMQNYNSGSMSVQNLVVTGTFNLMPKGMIASWSGTTIPSGWAKCDGTNGTPDLRSRFLVGTGQGNGLSNYNVYEEGGLENVTITMEQMPNHTHLINFDSGAFENRGCDNRMLLNWAGTNPGQPNSSWVVPATPETSPIYNYPSSETASHTNIPPYYALYYIMRII